MLKKYIKELWMNEVKYDMLIKMPSSYYSNDTAHKNDVKKTFQYKKTSMHLFTSGTLESHNI